MLKVRAFIMKFKSRWILCSLTHKRANIVYSEMYEILIRVIVRSTNLRLFFSEHFDYRCVAFLLDFGQIQSFAGVSFTPLDEHVGGAWIGFEVLVGQTLTHDKRYGGFIYNVRSGVNGKINLPIGIGGSQNAETLHTIEIIGQAHL
jgi:hypothetical protein